ncbi:MAG TPA: hypothetical protein VD736_01830 [Nitrososphaera sp.]|nr:hypothetical protein [Nitrososphaera sp.]
MLLAAMAIPPSYAQEGDYSSESLFMAVFANGDALVEYDVSIADPLDDEVRIKLFGETRINDLIVVDFEDQLVDYRIGETPNEIVLDTPGVSNVRISYTTPDLVDKEVGIWTFSLNTTIGLTVRLPQDSVLVDYEPIPSIRPIGDQVLLTFNKPGSIRVDYAIGVLGTEEQANIAIQFADAAIKETRRNHPNIILTSAEQLLQRARDAQDDRRFGEAESLAGDANEAALDAGMNYEPAQSEIASAESQIDQAAGQGRDIEAAEQLLEQAKSEFASGDYADARDTANDAIEAIGEMPPDPQVPIAAIIAVAAAAAGGVGALFFMRMRKPAQVQRREPPMAPNSSRTSAAVRPPEMKMDHEPAAEQEPVEESTPADPGTIPESQIDRSVLGRIVSKVLEERPHLRPEDQEVLKFLAEKEGAAFESEIRTKFQLPKTTIWRLVKRLEREELVEIRKAGGQNLIKLKFEDKMP